MKSFKNASIWAIIWRGILFSIPLFIAFGVMLALTDPLSPFSFLPEMIFSVGIYALIYYLTKRQLAVHNLSLTAVTGKERPDKNILLKLAGLTVIVALFGYSFLFFVVRLLVETEFFLQLLPFILPLLEGNPSFGGFLYLLITAVILAPLVEEFFFRGYVLNKWAEKHSPKKAVFWSSMFFMIVHMPSLFLPQLVASILCALVYLKTKKLVYPIFVHALYNFIILMPEVLSALFFETTQTSIEIEAFLYLMGSQESSVERLFQVLLPYGGIQAANVLSFIFLLTVPIVIYIFYRYGKNINQEETPYLANIPMADDIVFEEVSLSEEEYYKQLDEKKTEDSRHTSIKENNNQEIEDSNTEEQEDM